MIEAYKIAANLTITGDAHKKMMDFYLLVEKTSKKMESLIKLLRLTGGSFGNLGREIRESSNSVRQLDISLTRIGNHSTRIRTQIDGLRRSINSLTVASRGAGGGGVGAGGGALLGFASRHLAPAAIGYGGFRLGSAAFQTGVDFDKKIGQLVARGFTPAQISDVKNFASSTRIPGISKNELLDAYVDALMATADTGQAKFLAPTLAMSAVFARGTFGGMTHKQQQDLVRFAEFRGGGNASRIKDQLELGTQIMALSGGSIQPNQLRALASYGGGAVTRLTNEALIGLEPILQMRGGSKTGTALQTMALQLIAGQMSTARGRSLSSIGMFDQGGVKFDSSGRTLGSKFGTFKFANELQTDPFKFLMSRYLPAIAKQGVTSPGAIEQRIQYDFSRTASQLLISMYENSNKIIRTLGQANLLQKGTPMYQSFIGTRIGAQTRLGAAWENFKLALDEFDKPAVVAGLNMVSRVLEDLASVLNRFSNTGQHPINVFSIKDATSMPNGKNNQPQNVTVKLREKTLFDVIWGKTPNQMVDHGSTAILPSYQGVSPANNNLGGGVSQ